MTHILKNEMKSLTFDDFLDFYSPLAQRKKMKNIATLYNLLKVMEPLKVYETYSKDWLLPHLSKLVDKEFERNSPINIGANRPEFLTTITYHETGQIKNMAVESFGIKAYIANNYKGDDQPNYIIIKEWFREKILSYAKKEVEYGQAKTKAETGQAEAAAMPILPGSRGHLSEHEAVSLS
jgi:hypothetical protein